jgi:hypothetical protein
MCSVSGMCFVCIVCVVCVVCVLCVRCVCLLYIAEHLYIASQPNSLCIIMYIKLFNIEIYVVTHSTILASHCSLVDIFIHNTHSHTVFVIRIERAHTFLLPLALPYTHDPSSIYSLPLVL